MSFDRLIDLQERGAEARALGADAKDNPFLQAGTMPELSGEDYDEWREKRDAWHFGWVIENAYLTVCNDDEDGEDRLGE